MGYMIQFNWVHYNAFWSVLNVLLCAYGAQLGLDIVLQIFGDLSFLADPLEEVMIFGVSQLTFGSEDCNLKN